MLQSAKPQRQPGVREFHHSGNWPATFASLFCSCQISEAETKQIQRKRSK